MKERIQRTLDVKLAEGEGFEPPDRSPRQWFSRPQIITATKCYLFILTTNQTTQICY